MNLKNILLLITIFTCIAVFSKENVPNPNASNSVTYSKIAAGCAPASSQTDLDVNNVRATILGGGDMWWNLSDAQYEIPKGSGLNSLFAGSLWIGGVDAGVSGQSDNPFHFEEVKKNIIDGLQSHGFKEGNEFVILRVPNIVDISFGRGVGYTFTEHDLGEEIHKISATNIRKEMRNKGNLK